MRSLRGLPCSRTGLTCVDAHVALQRSRVCKLPLAMHADVGLLTTVDAQVALEVACRGRQGLLE